MYGHGGGYMLKPRETDGLREELLGERKISKTFVNEKEEEKEKEKKILAIKDIHFKIRYDFKGKGKPAKFFFGAKDPDEMACINREQQVSLWKNVPIQGINILKIEEEEVYSVFEEENDEELAFAPVIMEVKVDTLEDLIRFVVKEEFRRLEIIQPEEIKLTKQELERLLFKFHKSTRDQVYMQIKKIQD